MKVLKKCWDPAEKQMITPELERHSLQLTLPKTNSKFATQNQWLEDDISFSDGPIF